MFVKNLYEQVVTRIFNRDNRDDILFFILEELNKLCSNSIEYKKFVVTKSVGSVSRDKDTNKFVLEPYIDEKGNKGNHQNPVGTFAGTTNATGNQSSVYRLCPRLFG